MKSTKTVLSVVVAGATLLSPLLALADTNVSADATVGVPAVTASIGARIHEGNDDSGNHNGKGKDGMSSTTRMANIDARGNTEISKRLGSLTTLSARVNALKHISADEKASITANITALQSELTTLKAKVDADTDPATLKADVQSITKAYRVYALVIPQEAMLSASDRVQVVTGMMGELQTKLFARITAAASAGVDVSAAQAANADITAKVADANVNAQAAASEVASLKPDNGDKIVFAANQTALKDARAKLKVSEQDLKVARADVKTILGIVKGHGDATASTTVSH